MAWDFIKYVAFVVTSVLGAMVTLFVIAVVTRSRTSNRFWPPSTARNLVQYSSKLAIGGVIGTVAVGLTTLLVGELIAPSDIRLGREETWWANVQWSYVVTFAAMLCGMGASYFNKLINDRRAKIEQSKKTGKPVYLGLDFDAWDFAQPFLVSILTFGAIFASVDTQKFIH
jgi:hypothetical protein